MSEEFVEERTSTKRNTDQEATVRTQRRVAVSSGLKGVRQAAMHSKERVFTALLHHVTYDLLFDSFKKLKKHAAAGIDGTTWIEYQEHAEANISDLHDRVHRGSYRAMPSLRTFIPKPDGGKRPLGIAALEDKIVQMAVKSVLDQIYEVNFKGFSYGFRPERSGHDALDALYVAVTRKKINWILDADIQKYFDSIDHEWMLKFLEHRIKDKRIIRLVRKWLRAGVIEGTEWKETELGSPQGAVISPLLANIFLHYVLDIWVDWWRRKYAKGEVVIVRYADDFVLGFQYLFEAEAFLDALKARLGQFGLSLHPDKTRMIEFGRYAAGNRKKNGEGKPETFDFLGFTHICSRFPKGGFEIRRCSIKKRFRAKVKEVRRKIIARRHHDIEEQGKWIKSVILGYRNYFAVHRNLDTVKRFRGEVLRAWYRALRRRSQKGGKMPWTAFRNIYIRWMPRLAVLHPWPWLRFDAKYSR
ncbi:group II intron reverse transcriptase/maturase [Desulfonatronum thioautotrophicum]|uniref:group II intron reverse transcriptase/maturase n=1 Tax=Desulfonatronum thioautotrophicum TaxID=617001 RepID=UPI00069B96B3|nr:group II intron reverse transcriptase/maturase [Desulfonatronum thioautotrophicum]